MRRRNFPGMAGVAMALSAFSVGLGTDNVWLGVATFSGQLFVFFCTMMIIEEMRFGLAEEIDD